MFERKLLNLVWIYLNVQVLEPIFWREAGVALGKKQCTVVYTAVLLAPGLVAIHFAFLQCFHCTLGLGDYFKRLSGLLWRDSIGAFSAHLGSGMGLRCNQQELSDQLVVFHHKSVSLGN